MTTENFIVKNDHEFQCTRCRFSRKISENASRDSSITAHFKNMTLDRERCPNVSEEWAKTMLKLEKKKQKILSF